MSSVFELFPFRFTPCVHMTPYSLPALSLFSLLVYCAEVERVLCLLLVFSVVTSDTYVELG